LRFTTDHPNPLAERFTDYNAYLKWVADNPALGWRNIDVVSTQSPPAYQGDFVMTNLETKPREFLFILEGEKLPKDTLTQMFCAATGPTPAVDTSGEATGRDKSQITATSWLPGSFSAYFTATITLPPGQRWTPSMSGAHRTVRHHAEPGRRADPRPVAAHRRDPRARDALCRPARRLRHPARLIHREVRRRAALKRPPAGYRPSSFRSACRSSSASGLASRRGCGSVTSKLAWIFVGRGDSTRMRSAM
jgi:hypothetical protein